MSRAAGKQALKKVYIERDEIRRIVRRYEAAADAKDGDPCLLTHYAYKEVQTEFEKSLEVEAKWKASFDIVCAAQNFSGVTR